MCGIASEIIDRAEVAAKEFEHTSKLKESLEAARSGAYIPLGMQSDIAYALRGELDDRAMSVLERAIEAL